MENVISCEACVVPWKHNWHLLHFTIIPHFLCSKKISLSFWVNWKLFKTENASEPAKTRNYILIFVIFCTPSLQTLNSNLQLFPTFLKNFTIIFLIHSIHLLGNFLSSFYFCTHTALRNYFKLQGTAEQFHLIFELWLIMISAHEPLSDNRLGPNQHLPEPAGLHTALLAAIPKNAIIMDEYSHDA